MVWYIYNMLDETSVLPTMNRTNIFWVFLQVFLLFEFSYTSAAENAAGYEGAQVLNVEGTSHALRYIKRKGFDVWGSNGTFFDVLIPKNKLASVKDLLKKHAVSFGVKIADLEKAIKEENPVGKHSRAIRGSITFDNYQRLSTIHQYLDYLASTYPEVASVGIIGYTAERRPLKYIKISSGKPGAKVVFIDGGIHAREWVAPATVTYIIKQLVENRDNQPQELLDLDFYILPVLNPDGYEYTHTSDRMWRKNRSGSGSCLGADINRNFNFKFGGKGTSGDPCSETYRGRGPNSELEAQALIKFLTPLKGSLKAYITFHSYGQYILVPYGYDYDAFAPDFSEMKRVGDEAARAMRNAGGEYYTVGHTANTLYPAAGGSDDWTKANTGAKYVYCIELRDSGNYGFTLPARYILPTAREAFEGVKVIASAASKV